MSPPRRRAFLADLACLGAAGATSWLPVHAVTVTGPDGPPPLIDFPAGSQPYRQAFKNWSGEIAVDGVWTVAPATADEVVALVNWAAAKGWRVRARGAMHNWSPLTIEPGDTPHRVLLLDTTKHLTKVLFMSRWRLRVQTGITMERLLTLLAGAELGLTAFPDAGAMTLGGALAVNAHGTGIPAVGQARRAGGNEGSGENFGSLSNRVLDLTAVVHDPRQGRYVLRRITRSEADIGPLLAHLGRAFIVDVSLQIGRDEALRCTSSNQITFEELFAPPGSSGSTFANLLDRHGRLDVSWLPYTRQPLVRTWTVAPAQPAGTRRVTRPYNYERPGGLPSAVTALAERILRHGEVEQTPAFCAALSQALWRGVTDNDSADLWGPSHGVLLYVPQDIPPLTGNGYAIITRRGNVQRVVTQVHQLHGELLARERAVGRYPANGRVGLRVTSLDRPDEVDDGGSQIRGAVAPSLSALTPFPGRPEWDVAVWVDMLTLPGTPGAAAFYRDMERRLFALFPGDGAEAALRPEWSKGWAYTAEGAWADNDTLRRVVPSLFPASDQGAGWASAMATLERLDPARVFTTPLLDRLMPPPAR